MANEYDLNEHWKVINSGGQQVSTTPDQLWDAAVSYFKWCDDHPLMAKRTLTSGKTQGQTVPIEYVRPYTIEGMCLHCNISKRYMTDMKESEEHNSPWVMVIEKILSIIYTQNLEGAIVDLYNPIMVSKVLNMEKDNGDTDKPVRVEIVNSTNNELANSENEVLKRLDFGKMEILKEKVEKS